MRSATLYMQRGNYLSAIIIIKGLVGSSRQLFPSWQWSTLFSLFFFFVLSRSCFACISVPFSFKPCFFISFFFLLVFFFLVILSAIIRRAVIVARFRRKSWSNEAENFFSTGFRCYSLFVVSKYLFFSFFFFSKEFKFTIKYLRISMYNRRRCVAYRIKILHDL